MNARVYYEKAIRLCIAQGRICLFVIRDSKIVQILLKSVLRRKAGISQAVSLVLPFLQATVVEYLDVVLDDKRHDVVTQAFFEMEQSPDSAVAVLERVNSLKAVVEMELRRLAEYLVADENRFAEILARRSIKQVESEKKTVQSELRKSEMRIEIIPKLLKTLYEDKLSGKTSEDNYCVLSQEYSGECEQLQKRILMLRRKLTEMGEKENEREEFIHAIRKFMEMQTLTKQVLNELIDHIDVYETQGTGKNKTQRLVIYYKFVGYLDIDPTQCHPNYTADIREGVAIEYVSCEPSDSLKELFSEGYNADDDPFEEEEMEQA